VLVQTATVPIQAVNGSKILAKVLLDSASHHTFMTDRLAKQLKLIHNEKKYYLYQRLLLVVHKISVLMLFILI